MTAPQPVMALPGPTPVHLSCTRAGLRVIQQCRPHFGRDPAQLAPFPPALAGPAGMATTVISQRQDPIRTFHPRPAATMITR
jgi:hypothetical protein